ncbi:hypothetical protein [Capnocytophaga gingivalis]|uniref:hypothetical protein n=1 Tax=Capnocytophaga gingivalis TaxID=1017 RepID=UPI003C7018A4
MMRNIILISLILIGGACSKQSEGKSEEHNSSQETSKKELDGYKNSQSLFAPYIAQGSIFTREVKNMPLAKNSAAIAAYMPKMPAEYLPERFKSWLVTSLNTTNYNIPVYVVNSHDPQQKYANFTSTDKRVTHKEDLVKYTIGRIPLPSYAVPAGGGDKSFAVYDRATGMMREYFHAVKDEKGTWHFSASGYFSAKPNFKDLGKDNFAMQLTTGSSAVVGMLNPLSQIGIEEARKGEIRHALSFTIANAGKGFSYPAKQGDGTSTNPNAPLEGQWFRIDPKIDLNKLKLRPFTLVVAKAIQRYGGYASDKNLFCHAFNAEHPINEMAQGKPNPWEKGGDIYEKYKGIDLNDFPWHLTQWAPVDWGK